MKSGGGSWSATISLEAGSCLLPNDGGAKIFRNEAETQGSLNGSAVGLRDSKGSACSRFG